MNVIWYIYIYTYITQKNIYIYICICIHHRFFFSPCPLKRMLVPTETNFPRAKLSSDLRCRATSIGTLDRTYFAMAPWFFLEKHGEKKRLEFRNKVICYIDNLQSEFNFKKDRIWEANLRCFMRLSMRCLPGLESIIIYDHSFWNDTIDLWFMWADFRFGSFIYAVSVMFFSRNRGVDRDTDRMQFSRFLHGRHKLILPPFSKSNTLTHRAIINLRSCRSWLLPSFFRTLYETFFWQFTPWDCHLRSCYQLKHTPL